MWIVAVVVDVAVTVVVLVLAGRRDVLSGVRATMSPGVVPGHVDTASKLHVPTGDEDVLLPVDRCSDRHAHVHRCADVVVSDECACRGVRPS